MKMAKKPAAATKSPFANVQVFAMSEDETEPDDGGSSSEPEGIAAQGPQRSNAGLTPDKAAGSPSALALSTSPSKCPHCTIHSWLPHSPQCPRWNNRNKKK